LTLWTRFEQLFKKWGMRLLEGILGKAPLHPEDFMPETVNKILVIRQHDQLGDLLLSTPVLRALRQHFPEAHIALLVRNYTHEVVKYNQYINEVIVFQEIGYNWTLNKFKKFIKKIFTPRDLTIVLNTVSHSFTSDLFAFLSRAPYILGSKHLLFPGCKRNFFYNLHAPYRKGIRNQSERNLDIVRYLGINTVDPGEHITLLDEEVRWANKALAQAGVRDNELVIGIHPGAGKIRNRWDVSNFAQAANSLHQTYNAKIIINCGSNEHLLVDSLVVQLKCEPIIFENLDLRQLAALISRYDLFLCNDTGVLHVAAAVGTPLVVIFGPTDPLQWKPIGERFIAVRGINRSCNSVSVEEVLQKAEMLLGENPET